MSSLSRPQSSAAMRSPPGFSYPSLHADPTAIFASESRKFLSSRKGERQYTSPPDLDRDSTSRHRSGSYSNNVRPSSPESYYHQQQPQQPSLLGRSSQQRQQMAAEIGRSSTVMPSRSYRDDIASPKGIYPPLPPSSTLRKSSTMAPYSSYASPDDPYASHRHRSPVYSPPPSSAVSTNSAGSPPPSLPQSPTRNSHHLQHHGVHHSSHGRHQSLSTTAYATDYAGSSKLVPGRGAPVKRHTQQYSSSSGLGAVGPALAQNIPPVLPRPPSLKGTSSSSLGRSGSLRVGSRKGDVKTVTDEEQAAYAALNTYR